MKSIESLVCPESEYYLYHPSAIASRVYLYPVDTGYFYYEPGYHLKRTCYENFLLMFIVKGKLTLRYRGQKYTAQEGQVVLLDCHEPHEYGNMTTCRLEIAWLHFDGLLARSFFDMIYENRGPVIRPSNTYPFSHNLQKILDVFKTSSPIKEAEASRRITTMLSELLESDTETPEEMSQTESIENALTYISEHFTEPLTLEMIADHISLSPYYFSRIFFKKTGFTPHQYIIALRIDYAKYLLLSGTASIKEIAFSSGFSTQSSFCYTFKKREGLSPGVFRKNSGVAFHMPTLEKLP